MSATQEERHAASEAQRQAVALALEASLPYTGLRGFRPDQRLFAYLPVGTARKLGVLPLALVGDTLRVASATVDPPLGPIQTGFPNLRFEVAIAPRREIDAILDQHDDAA